jgi:regulatory protein
MQGAWRRSDLMGTITAIEPQKRDPERVSVYVDGSFAFGVTRMLMAARGLRAGSTLSDEEADALRHDDELERAYNASLGYLSYRPRSRQEILDYLRKKNIRGEDALAVTERLERIGLLDDREFARFWVENRLAFRPKGTLALRVELRQKGVGSDVIGDALDSIEDEEPIAYEVAKKKARSYAGLDPREFSTRMIGFLQRRGFPYGVAARVVRRMAEEAGLEEDDSAVGPE